MSVKEAAAQINATVMQWPGVTAHPHRFGGTEYRLGKRELGHIHGDHLVDIPFPTRHQQTQRITLFRAHHLAVLRVSDKYIIEDLTFAYLHPGWSNDGYAQIKGETSVAMIRDLVTFMHYPEGSSKILGSDVIFAMGEPIDGDHPNPLVY